MSTHLPAEHIRYRNDINRASWRLSALEQRIVLTAITRGGGVISDDLFYEVSANDLEELGTSRSKAYEALQDAASNLFNRFLRFDLDREKGDFMEVRWVQAVRYKPGTGVIGVRFTKDLIPYLSELKEQYTQFGRLELIGIDSQYAMRIYSLLMQYRDTGWFKTSVEELRKLLDVGQAYPRYNDFKRNVLEIAKNQINRGVRTTISFTYEEIKRGRAVTMLSFHITAKQPAIEMQPSERFALSPRQIEVFADWLSGRNKDKLGIKTPDLPQEGYSPALAVGWLQSKKYKLLPKNFDISSTDAICRGFQRYLKDPAFVESIYENWLRPLGAKL